MLYESWFWFCSSLGKILLGLSMEDVAECDLLKHNFAALLCAMVVYPKLEISPFELLNWFDYWAV